MAATRPRTRPKSELEGPCLGGAGDSGRGRGGGHGGDSQTPLPPETYRLGVWIGLCSIAMLFIALTSAYVVRQGLGGDWQPVQMPRLLWWTTAILLGSSLTLELARSSLKRGEDRDSSAWLTVTLLLGVGFLLGQLLAWQQLAAQGIYLNTNPHSSFFYLLSGTHGLHVVGGLIALAYVVWGAWWHRYTRQQHTALDGATLYWHFMDGLWVYLLVVLFVWR